MEIRRARPADLRGIRRTVIESWNAAYADVLAAAALPDADDAEAFLPRDALRTVMWTQEVLFLVADAGGTVVGEAQFATGPWVHEFVADDDGEAQLQSLYVRPDRWREGAGSRLIEAGIDRLDDDYDAVVVEVLAGNEAGRRFYRQQGFEAVDERTVELAGERYPSTIMRRSIG
jgi:ribosomal protein S18 acetylase RimI-like enzyme